MAAADSASGRLERRITSRLVLISAWAAKSRTQVLQILRWAELSDHEFACAREKRPEEAVLVIEYAAVLPTFSAMRPLGRNGQPVDAVEALLFLASDQASFITGRKHWLLVHEGVALEKFATRHIPEAP